MSLECHWLIQCTLGYHLVSQRILVGYTGTPLENLRWNCPALKNHWRNWLLQPTLGHHWRDYRSPHTPRHIKLSRVASMPILHDRMAGHQAANGQVSVNPAFTWSLLLCSAYQFWSPNAWVLQHQRMRLKNMSTILVFVYLGLQFKRNQFSSNICRHTSFKHKCDLACWPPNQMLLILCDTTGQTSLEAH